jgi:hypothetical protein
VDIELNVATGDHLVKESVIAVLPGLNNAPAAQP